MRNLRLRGGQKQSTPQRNNLKRQSQRTCTVPANCAHKRSAQVLAICLPHLARRSCADPSSCSTSSVPAWLPLCEHRAGIASLIISAAAGFRSGAVGFSGSGGGAWPSLQTPCTGSGAQHKHVRYLHCPRRRPSGATSSGARSRRALHACMRRTHTIQVSQDDRRSLAARAAHAERQVPAGRRSGCHTLCMLPHSCVRCYSILHAAQSSREYKQLWLNNVHEEVREWVEKWGRQRPLQRGCSRAAARESGGALLSNRATLCYCCASRSRSISACTRRARWCSSLALSRSSRLQAVRVKARNRLIEMPCSSSVKAWRQRCSGALACASMTQTAAAGCNGASYSTGVSPRFEQKQQQ